MTIIFLVNKHTGRGFDRADINHEYDKLIKTRHMDKDCYMNDPPKVFTFLGLPIDSVMIAHAGHVLLPGQLEALRFQRSYWSRKENKTITYGHFTAGNGKGWCTYDPAGNSNAVKYGHLESKRIFTRSK